MIYLCGGSFGKFPIQVRERERRKWFALAEKQCPTWRTRILVSFWFRDSYMVPVWSAFHFLFYLLLPFLAFKKIKKKNPPSGIFVLWSSRWIFCWWSYNSYWFSLSYNINVQPNYLWILLVVWKRLASLSFRQSERAWLLLDDKVNVDCQTTRTPRTAVVQMIENASPF